MIKGTFLFYVFLSFLIGATIWNLFDINQEEAWENVVKSYDVFEGMDKASALTIMGIPDSKLPNENADTTYHYATPIQAKKGIDICFDSLGRVFKVVYYEN
ncbi:hypothetical protein [Echinicola sp. 20G]|uniref:hypothetical protein n=1 Tax=Echinicola sp. 20G TaxID=2781961 RepID=UPI0019102914|nr:hypothetical protein [Echinicola sp. 20G]